MNQSEKTLYLFGGLALLFALVFAFMGAPFSIRLLAEAACYAILALGLTIQWGYAGLFNAGIMGFVALGGYMSVLLGFPINDDFWSTDLPGQLGGVILKAVLVIAVVVGLTQLKRFGAPKKLGAWLGIIVGLLGYLWIKVSLDPVASAIESQAGFIGGLGLPVWLGWLVGGALAGAVAYFIGHICLGLRSDYLAIATLGIAEIIKAFLKNADWLTRGTLTVSPIPWPVPGPADIGFIGARAAYLSLTAVIIAGLFFLLHRAYNAPWGRTMRSIRDNELSSAAMGKDVNGRRLEVFVLGSVLMGIGGAALITFNGIFDPSGFLPLNHTFLIWVMVILGGPGNNLGTLFGAVFVYVVWTMSEPVALLLLDIVRHLGDAWFGWQAPSDLDSRALQARVFVIGLIISLVLRYAPKGLIPEQVKHHS
ncbi:branched-chain amino acid ABC transporter permease [Saccharospirillum mangrovi]|uniref:branched-chain amino acid ABC transporter permease n=1 Tax=Saccharospirillum mangrovi TaxID=2161747 RepID=UPI000D35B0FA|nr:branched-chain amino acid ABC transporter permease [Saccharospirillum mangrovi]